MSKAKSAGRKHGKAEQAHRSDDRPRGSATKPSVAAKLSTAPKPAGATKSSAAARSTVAAAKQQRSAAASGLPIVIVGFGRLGGALARSLKKAKREVYALPRSGESVRRAAGYGIPLADHDDLLAARIAILAVPDSSLGEVAKSIAEDLHPSCAIVHLAGALPVDVLGSVRGARPLGSFHPLCAVSSPDDELAGHSVAISATKPALEQELKKIALALGLDPLSASEKKRAAYHAAAVLSAGGLVSLLSTAVGTMRQAGVSEKAATEALVRLMRSALVGVEQRGLSGGLTGPIPRGDVEVVRGHLEALSPEAAELYRALSRGSLELARRRLGAEAVTRLELLLRA